jgi:hypothetical protein
MKKETKQTVYRILEIISWILGAIVIGMAIYGVITTR